MPFQANSNVSLEMAACAASPGYCNISSNKKVLGGFLLLSACDIYPRENGKNWLTGRRASSTGSSSSSGSSSDRS